VGQVRSGAKTYSFVPTYPVDGKRGLRSLHILLAEDDQELRELIASSLRMAGHRVTEVADTDAMEAELVIAGLPEADPLDLAISDIRMPGKHGTTGMDVLARLRDCLECPPFLFMTAFSEPEVVQRARDLGAIGLIDKPFSMRALLAIVNQHSGWFHD